MTYDDFVKYSSLTAEELIELLSPADLVEYLAYEYGNHDNGDIDLKMLRKSLILKDSYYQ